MAGIYIHIPFCRKACHYCNFHFSTSASNITEMVKAIIKEAELRKDQIIEGIHTVYFGGGTPSLLAIEDLRFIITELKRLFIVAPGAEITLEANPDDINEEKLLQWKESGINRLSIGIQSFFEEDLQWMNRAHNAQQAVDSLQLALKQFDNITIDLIYGTPTLTDENWKRNVEKAIELNIPHLSCYALTVEPKTALDTLIQQKKKENIDAEKQARHFELLVQWTKDAGYEHYEISNFAKPGYRSRHNSSYWQGKPYLGLGPSAHSFNGSEREWNVSNNALYLKSIEQGIVPSEKEVLTDTQQLNEYVMTSLRTMEGLSLQFVSVNWGSDMANAIKKDAAIFLDEGTMTASNDHLILTDAGKLLADGIAAELFR
jgi:oxygen-independent coproporphyrinogen III oxidase